MKNLRNRFERFCFRNRAKGIPNLMLYISLGTALVYMMSLFVENGAFLYELLCFNRRAILQGQVWRLVTFVFTTFPPSASPLLAIISMVCYYSLGRAAENTWGTLRFNLFYLTGVLLMDAFAMGLGGIPVAIGGTLFDVSFAVYASMGSSLNLSLFLAYATMYPSAQFLLLFIIPVRAWVFALFNLVVTAFEIWSLSYPINYFPHSLFPLVAIANYLLFFGKDVLNVIPLSWRLNARRLFKKKPKAAQKPKVVPFPSAGSYEATTAKVKAPYTHRCTVCARTDVDSPELEFRYCSRCKGYHCYCLDHINNHTHIE